MERSRNISETGGSTLHRIAAEIGEIARTGAGIARIIVDEVPKLFDPNIGILANHKPEDNLTKRI